MKEMQNNLGDKNNQENKIQVDAALSDWEESMISELSDAYGISDDIVLNIGVTFLMNELSASMNGKPSLLNSIHAAGLNNDTNLPDVTNEES